MWRAFVTLRVPQHHHRQLFRPSAPAKNIPGPTKFSYLSYPRLTYLPTLFPPSLPTFLSSSSTHNLGHRQPLKYLQTRRSSTSLTLASQGGIVEKSFVQAPYLQDVIAKSKVTRLAISTKTSFLPTSGTVGTG